MYLYKVYKSSNLFKLQWILYRCKLQSFYKIFCIVPLKLYDWLPPTIFMYVLISLYKYWILTKKYANKMVQKYHTFEADIFSMVYIYVNI